MKKNVFTEEEISQIRQYDNISILVIIANRFPGGREIFREDFEYLIEVEKKNFEGQKDFDLKKDDLIFEKAINFIEKNN